jgi:hypothetical protein
MSGFFFSDMLQNSCVTVSIPLLMTGLCSQLGSLLQKISCPLLIRAIAPRINFTLSDLTRAHGSIVVMALCYKLEGRRFDSR